MISDASYNLIFWKDIQALTTLPPQPVGGLGTLVTYKVHNALQSLILMWWHKVMSDENKTRGRTYQVAEPSVQSDEVEGDGSVAVVDHEDRQQVQALTWDGMGVRWRV